MTPNFISEAVRLVIETYGTDHVRVAKEGERTVLKIEAVELYATSQPPSTPMLILFDPNQAKPIPYVRPGQLLANGKPPRSTSITIVGGESWMAFSFQIPWCEAHGIIRFIAAARQRFAQND